jgi:hypothetical protein
MKLDILYGNTGFDGAAGLLVAGHAILSNLCMATQTSTAQPGLLVAGNAILSNLCMATQASMAQPGLLVAGHAILSDLCMATQTRRRSLVY